MTYTQDYEQFLNESVLDVFKNFFTDKNYQDIKKVAFHEYLETSRKGDLQTSYLKKSSFPTPSRWMWSRLTSLAQGQLFNTLKMVEEGNQTIIGYGTNVSKKAFNIPVKLEEYPIRKYLMKAESAILLRPKDISSMQIEKALKYLKERVEKDYDYSGLVKSAFTRVYEYVKRIITSDEKEAKEISNRFVKNFKAPMFCSNVIAMAYKYAKYDTGLGYQPIVAWPCDFLESDRFEKVCIYRKRG